MRYIDFSSFHTQAYRRNARIEISSWLADQDVTHFVTLNFNRPATESAAKRAWGAWLARIDRRLLGRRWSKKGDDRTFGIAFIENPLSNIHLHCMIRFPIEAWEIQFPALQSLVASAWRSIIYSGSVDIQPIENSAAVSRYSTKQLASIGGIDRMLLSTEFHTYRK